MKLFFTSQLTLFKSTIKYVYLSIMRIFQLRISYTNHDNNSTKIKHARAHVHTHPKKVYNSYNPICHVIYQHIFLQRHKLMYDNVQLYFHH